MSKSSSQANRPSIKFRRLLFRDPSPEESESQVSEPSAEFAKGKYKFIVLKMSWDQALSLRDEILPKYLETIPILSKVIVRNLNPNKDKERFVQAYNRAFITAPDPFRSITIEDIDHFDPFSTFVAVLYGKIIGFVILIIEPLTKRGIEVGKQGVIAGIGVVPRYRRKHVAFLLAAKAAEFFEENQVSELICEVYHQNNVSYNFIRNFGFTETGVTFL